jgi:nicotinamidase-related amidase
VSPALCRAEASQLLVVDVQPRLAAAMPDADRQRTLRNLGVLLEAAQALQVPVIATEQYPKGLGATEPPIAARFPAAVRLFTKTSFSCCGADGFLAGLAPGRPQVVIGGMETHVCVLQTAFDLHARGLQVFVVGDAVCSRDPDNRQDALERLRQGGIAITSTESVVFEWLRDAAHPQFRTLSALLK